MLALAVAIDVAGERFTPAAPVTVDADPGMPVSTTIALTWREHGVEMRLFVSLRSDGREWWSDGIRSYDGNSPPPPRRRTRDLAEAPGTRRSRGLP